MITTNKTTFKSECFNLHLFHKGSMYENECGLMLAPTNGYANPPVTKEDLKRLANFILEYLENN